MDRYRDFMIKKSAQNKLASNDESGPRKEVLTRKFIGMMITGVISSVKEFYAMHANDIDDLAIIGKMKTHLQT